VCPIHRGAPSRPRRAALQEPQEALRQDIYRLEEETGFKALQKQSEPIAGAIEQIEQQVMKTPPQSQAGVAVEAKVLWRWNAPFGTWSTTKSSMPGALRLAKCSERHQAMGIRNVNRVSSTVDTTLIRPACASAICAAM
jgi:hypothetical protein